MNKFYWDVNNPSGEEHTTLKVVFRDGTVFHIDGGWANYERFHSDEKNFRTLDSPLRPGPFTLTPQPGGDFTIFPWP